MLNKLPDHELKEYVHIQLLLVVGTFISMVVSASPLFCKIGGGAPIHCTCLILFNHNQIKGNIKKWK